MKILIYDDEERPARAWGKQIAKVLGSETTASIELLGGADFSALMEVLTQRRAASRNGRAWSKPISPLDGVSILIVDYDLLGSSVSSYLTGEEVAYLARCFSNCGIILGINQYLGGNPFDLSLRGHPESFADLNVQGKQLGNPGLWRNTSSGFRPWHWPILPDYARDFERRVGDVRTGLDEPIWSILGFERLVFERLPRAIGEFIGEEPATTTWRQFAARSNYGLRGKDSRVTDDGVLARVGAAGVSKWLEQSVLPREDILVDAPHLISRFPSLIAGDVEDIDAWNRTTRLGSYQDLGMKTELIEPFRLQRSHWVSRPVWLWESLRECEEIEEIREPWKTMYPKWVFCEDMSQFYAGEDYWEFIADVDSPFSRRFVRRFDDVEYQNEVRFIRR